MVLPFMYPAKIDRYRIIEKLVRWARKTCHLSETGKIGIKQTALAERASVTQSTVSNLENLATSFRHSKRFPGREELLKVLTWGLELQQDRIDPLLWLYDGQPLSEEEIRRYVRGYQPEATAKDHTFPELRRLVLEQLEEILTDYTRSDGIRVQPVKVIPSGGEQEELEAYAELLHMEQEPGQSFVIIRHPSHLVHPPEMHASGELIRPPVITEEGRRRWLVMNQQRLEGFLSNLATYGERSLHSKPILKNYLKEKYLSRTDWRRRKKQIQHWITLLETYELYQVGLAEVLPYFDLKIKSTVKVMVRSPLENGEKYPCPQYGPRYFLWTDENMVLRFFLDFENLWDAIPEADRTKEKVIRFLREVVEGKA
jgi:transcriptional regulator with XRE-family HTH domain